MRNHRYDPAYLSREFDDPRWGNDDARMDSQGTRLLNLLHHEAADLVVVGDLAPRTTDCYDFLQAEDVLVTSLRVCRLAFSAHVCSTDTSVLSEVIWTHVRRHFYPDVMASVNPRVNVLSIL